MEEWWLWSYLRLYMRACRQGRHIRTLNS
jgi:hypothetical protein